jgi:hypothetical protein
MLEQELFTVVEVAKMLKVSRDTITRRFENEPGVIDLGVPTRRYKGVIAYSGFPLPF